ncbi:RagB/SusD family nutrient uptake outer membrane protein [Spirosoma endbachense]|uniref:RagB/SusD family nutrient uptake outer membrane protein n=1 Tax=Spirosoma endbachense TaxID=2666025 RepID=A0A6P1VWU9_9BACT|nr:RagB/SusD family nutrient uptake outer membrane protein [Spirosoma endbachense]QHV96848.1 RagB/SusD family nutrient uptake outer membrane protein [Spirosoma endbachense]
MKKILPLIAVFSLLITSCSKQFIEILPVDTVTVDVLYKTDKDYQDAVIGVYGIFQDQYQNMYYFGDIRGDDVWDELVKGTAGAVDNFTLANDDALLINTWRNYYKAITRANALLERISTADASITNKNRHTGEAEFLRALAYFDLVRIFGDVPFVTKSISIDESYKTPREKVDKIYDEIIIKDLLDAEAKLPASYTGPDVGRATKGAAKALLGKVYLTRKDFAKAETKLQEVTTMGYALLPNWADLWDYSKNEHHSEYIFDIEYEQGLGGEGSIYTNRFTPKVTSMIAFYGIAGSVDDQNTPHQVLFDLFEAKDKRKDITASKGYTDGTGKFIPILISSNNMSAYTRKYIARITTANDSPADWKVIRYADVLLMYAEALNENGKTSTALPLLNQIRTRVGVDPYTALTQTEMRDKIALERRMELAFEGHRWFDLVRTGQAYTVMQKYGMKPHNTLWPIPFAQIQLVNNRAIFPQNPGYD